MNTKRILVIALALMVMAMPIGLAEAGYGALTLSNFHVDVGTGEPMDIEAAIRIGVGGQDDGSGRLDIDVTGGGQSALSASAAFDAEKVQAIVDGSSYLFEVPMAELQKLMESTAGTDSPTGSMTPEDMQKIKDLFASYVALLEKYSDPKVAAEFSTKVLSVLNIEEKGKEQVSLFDQSMELNRFDLSMTGEDLGKLYTAMFEAEPDFQKIFAAYFELLGQASGKQIDITADDLGNYIANTLKESGVDLKMDMSVWTDTEFANSKDANAVKEEITVTVTAPKSEITSDETATPAPDAAVEMETVQFPMTVDMLKSDAGTHVAYSMNITPPDESGSLTFAIDATFDAPSENGGTESFGGLTMNFDTEGTASDVSFTASFGKTQGSDNLPHLYCSLNGSGEGQTFDLSFGYDGVTATETEQSGTVTIQYNIPEAGAGTFSCDVMLEKSAFTPLGDADFAGKTKIDPITASGDEMTQVETELQGVLMQAMGVLMQTPGLSNIMGSMMNSDTAA